MTGAIFMVHLPFGFFMNWTGTLKGEGFEFHLLMIGLLLSTLVAGPGRLSLGHLLPLPKFME
jgi:putative oxidoreductase